MASILTLEEAVSLIGAHTPALGEERLPLGQALGRTLAEDVSARIHQPPFPRSPLDGYALYAADTQGATPDTPRTLPVVDTIYAGAVPTHPLYPGQAMRIFTGAMLPQGCDSVIRQEDTDLGTERVSVRRELSPGANCIPRGSDFQAGDVLLPAHTRLDAAALGLLASSGIVEIPVHTLPVVGLLTTGDEVVEPACHPLPPGKVYNSIACLLSARLHELGLTQVRTCHVGDDPAQAAHALSTLLEVCDCLITIGGVSVGDKDILHQTLPLVGAKRLFWRVDVQPGTPAMFSVRQGTPILSLSGNPFAAFATFELLARPMLAALCQQPDLLPRKTSAVLHSPFPKASPRRRFVRGYLKDTEVTLPANHASGVLSSLVGCNCLVEFPAGTPPLSQPTPVQVYI